MFKAILLLTPLYVALFWSISLNCFSGMSHKPKRFLGKFMIASFVISLSHFLFFTSYTEAYSIIDPFYQFASLLVYPLYYIYFRLLTIDERFSIRKHGLYLLAPTLLFILYFIGVLFTPSADFKVWVLNRGMHSDVSGIRYLKVVDVLIKIVFIAQVLFTLISNFYLLRKYRVKAKQYYSDIQDGSISKIKLLNLTLAVCAVSSIVLKILGQHFFIDEITGLAIACVVFSIVLFIIGWLGIRQNPINPAFEVNPDDTLITEDELPAGSRQQILEKIISLFKNDKIYLNNKLTIQDIAQAVGTNRTYISSTINQKFNQNFCSFVNNYRIEELEKIVVKHPEYTNQVLADASGFGSIDSLKRAIYAKTRLNIIDWKAGLLKSAGRN